MMLFGTSLVSLVEEVLNIMIKRAMDDTKIGGITLSNFGS